MAFPSSLLARSRLFAGASFKSSGLASGYCPTAIRRMSFLSTKYKEILVSKPANSVALIALNRPNDMNALTISLIGEMNQALVEADEDKDIRAIVLTGCNTTKIFAHPVDVRQMKESSFVEMFTGNFMADFGNLSYIKKPIIAAVNGPAFGGGCELALMCDIAIAAPCAKFAQLEINVGIIPGGGGTQRLTKAIGKSRAMEVVLTGREIAAQEAAQWGMVSKVSATDDSVVNEAVTLASTIGTKGGVSVIAGKLAVNNAFDHLLTEGINTEGRLFQSFFATNDQKEGMNAYLEKRVPHFTNT